MISDQDPALDRIRIQVRHNIGSRSDRILDLIRSDPALDSDLGSDVSDLGLDVSDLGS